MRGVQETVYEYREQLFRYVSNLNLVDGILIVAILLFWLVTYSQDLSRSMQLWDEALYANIARHTAQYGPWIIPHTTINTYSKIAIGEQPFLLKPPLGFWLQALSIEIVGVSKFAIRLPSVLFSGMTVILTFLFTRYLYNRLSGAFASIAFLSIPHLFRGSHGGRAGTLDATLLFFGTLFVMALYIYLCSRRESLLIISGIALGSAILTKGFGAGIFAVIGFPLVLFLLSRHDIRGLLILVFTTSLTISPWIIAATIISPGALVKMFMEQVVQRISGDLNTYPATYSFMKYGYFRSFPSFYDPWGYIAPFAAIALIISEIRSRNSFKAVFISWWASSVFFFFVLTGNHNWYILPMAVPVAILCGRCIDCSANSILSQIALVTGATLAIIFGYQLRAPITTAYSVIGLPGDPMFGAVVLLLIGIFIYRHLENMSSSRMKIGKVLICLLLLSTFTVQMSAMELKGPAASQEQEVVGSTVQAINSNEVIYVEESIDAPIYNFVFAADSRLKSMDITQLNDASPGDIIVIYADDRDKIKQNHNLVGELSSDYYRKIVVIEIVPTQNSKEDR